MNHVDSLADMFAQLLQSGCVTGSRRWGVGSVCSDFDLVLTTEIFKELRPAMKKMGLIFSNVADSLGGADIREGSESWRVQLFGFVLNLIVVSEKEYAVWYKASNLMDSYIARYELSGMDRNIRVDVFMQFKEALRRKEQPDLTKIHSAARYPRKKDTVSPQVPAEAPETDSDDLPF